MRVDDDDVVGFSRKRRDNSFRRRSRIDLRVEREVRGGFAEQGEFANHRRLALADVERGDVGARAGERLILIMALRVGDVGPADDRSRDARRLQLAESR